MLTRSRRVLTSLLTVALVSLPLMLGALMPAAAQARAICSLPPRLKAGDAVEVTAGAANRLRYGPGLSYATMAISVNRGEVWYVESGPVCADGINWYRVAAHDAKGWTAEGQRGTGYYLGRTTQLPEEGAVVPSCVSQRLAAGIVVAVSDGVRQQVHREARKNSPQVAWLSPNVPVTIVKGPLCADGWIWWHVSSDNGRLQGWMSEGDGAETWLAPVTSRGTASGDPGSRVAAAPTLVGAARVGPTKQYAAIFSPDRQAFTLSYADFIVQTSDNQPSVTRRETVVLPVRSGAKGYRARATIAPAIHCDPGSLATVTFQVGTFTKRIACEGTPTGFLTVDVVQSPNADLPLYITAHAERQKPGAYAVVNIDLIDLSVSSR